MFARIISLRSIAPAALIFAWGVSIGLPAHAVRASTCLTAPNSKSPKGSHWYYHTDRATQRKCWFLGTLSQPTHHTAAHATSPKVRARRAGAAKKMSTTTSAAAPMPPRIGSNTPPSLRPRHTQSAATRSAAAHEPVLQRFRQGDAAPSTTGSAVPPASASFQSGAQAPATASAATFLWPDPPTVGSQKAQQPGLLPSDARAHSVTPPMDARVSRDSGGAARSDVTTATATVSTLSPAVTPAKMLLAAALALIVAGVLFHLVTKVAATRGRRILIDHAEPNRIDERNQQARQEDRPRPRFIRRKPFVDDSNVPLVPATSDYGAQRPLPADDARQNNTLHQDSASQTTNEVSAVDSTLAQLIRDIDELMQSTNRAERSGSSQERS
jgi:hypothetical protein